MRAPGRTFSPKSHKDIAMAIVSRARASARRRTSRAGVRRRPPKKAAAARRVPRKKPGPKPGTPSWRRFRFSAEATEDIRRRFEETTEPVTSIARDYAVDESTIRRLAKDYGWVRRGQAPVDLAPDVRLRRQAEKLAEELSSLPVPARGRRAEDEDASLTPTPNLPLAGGGSGEISGPPFANPETVRRIAETIAEMLREVQAQLVGVTALRERMKGEPQKPADGQTTSRTLSNLTATLSLLQRMQCAPGTAPASSSGADDYDDDMPRDIDEFRRELARRINEFVRSRTQPDDAGGGGEDSAPLVDQA
jgi:hypothetical protein